MTHGITQGLLEAMLVAQVRNSELYSADGSTIRYRVRDRSLALSSHGVVATIGDAALGGLGLSAVLETFGTEIDFIDAHPHGMCLMAVHSGQVGFRYASTGDEIKCDAGSVGVFEVERGSTGSSADATTRTNLWIVRSKLQERLEASLERSCPTPLRFAPPHRWPPGTASSLRRLIAFAAAELEDPYSMLAGGTGLAEFEDLVLRTLIESVPNSYCEILDSARAPAAPVAFRRAREFMRAHVSEPLTVPTIAAHAGCSPRALAAACQSYGGATIATMLRNMRLDAAHAQLLRGDPAASVAGIAQRLQFSNPGRFSRQYRARFGVLPGRTGRRGNWG